MKPVAIVVLSRYWEIFRAFLESAERFAPNAPKILVLDPGDEKWPGPIETPGWLTVAAPTSFAMARNANLGVRAASAAYPDCDILYCGDDIRFLDANVVERLQAVAYEHPDVGILSPRLQGRASAPLANPLSECDYVPPVDMWFPCVYLKRECLNAVGEWDERFTSFGDDFDYCVRAEFAGYKCAVTNAVTVLHEAHPGGGPTTFKRAGGPDWKKPDDVLLVFAEKYGVTLDRLRAYFNAGDLKLLWEGTGCPNF